MYMSGEKKLNFELYLFWHNDVLHRTDGIEFYFILLEAVVCFRHADMTLILLLYRKKKVLFVKFKGYDF